MNKFSYLIFILFLAFSSQMVIAQSTSLTYNIISKGDTVGNMQIVQSRSGNDVTYSVASRVTTKMLMTIKVNVQEEAHYKNTKLVSSSSQRLINDKPKGNRKTQAMDDYYLLSGDAQTDTLHEKEILYDFSLLYFKEPVNAKQVYSNFYQRLLPIVPAEPHSYRVDLPDSGSNVYYYVNGVCVKVDMRSSLFNAQMLLSQ